LEHIQSPGTPAVAAASHLDQHPVSANESLTVAPGSTAGMFSYAGNAGHRSDMLALVHPESTFVTQAGHPVHAVGPLDGPNGDIRAVPFKVTGGGPAPDGLPLIPGQTAPHSATGTATHLGKYTGAGTFQLGSVQISPTGQVSGTFQGNFVFVAANGDQLACNYGSGDSGTFTGQLSADGTTVTNVRFVAVFTPDPSQCTGRFADVVGGGFTMIANADSISLNSTVPGYTAPFNYTWSGAGTLQFSK
jgi:hypothetical protein